MYLVVINLSNLSACFLFTSFSVVQQVCGSVLKNVMEEQVAVKYGLIVSVFLQTVLVLLYYMFVCNVYYELYGQCILGAVCVI